MITIFIHIQSLIIGIVIGFCIATGLCVLFMRFEPTDFQSGYETGKKEAEKEIKNGRDGKDEH